MTSHPSTSRQRGFSLIELLIGMVIAIEILVAALTIFDVHNRMARLQLQITDMQQSLRVAQYDLVRTTRMAGRGGLPIGPGTPPSFFIDTTTLSVDWLRGFAVEARDNVAEGGDNEVALGTASPLAVPGTDILTVRGCLSGQFFQLDPTIPGDFTGASMIVRRDLSSGRSQDIAELLAPGFSGPILLQSAINRMQYAIGEVGLVTGTPETQATLAISFASLIGNPYVVAPPADFVPGFACTLEEYRYYVRQNFETPGDDATPLKPRLARARMIPGTELPYAGDEANLSLDLADDIFDLQIALGFDTNFDSAGSGVGSFDADTNNVGPDDVFYEGVDNAARATDDWLGNSSGDVPAAAGGRLYYVRISTLARTARRDPKYSAPDFDPVAGVDFIENNNYDVAPANAFKTPENRQYRHRLLQTVVDLRNI